MEKDEFIKFLQQYPKDILVGEIIIPKSENEEEDIKNFFFFMDLMIGKILNESKRVKPQELLKDEIKSVEFLHQNVFVKLLVSDAPKYGMILLKYDYDDKNVKFVIIYDVFFLIKLGEYENDERDKR